MVKLLIEKGAIAIPEQRGIRRLGPLYCAVILRHLEIVETILQTLIGDPDASRKPEFEPRCTYLNGELGE